ncbi:hypothetical protein WN51_07079 [Melipona quadrifasciata]|uniref:Uncharacterized protein n=1 Tax=Melipona quadrifasciata TaxID=166423 RepID=A0A0N0BC99_9HYME|nr:hypothetical protein WN51_07079 [Melipona quadrifasciata]
MIRLLDLDETPYIQQSKRIKKEYSMTMYNNEDTSMGRSLLSFFDKYTRANVHLHTVIFFGEQEVHLCLIKLTSRVLFLLFLEVVKNLAIFFELSYP